MIFAYDTAFDRVPVFRPRSSAMRDSYVMIFKRLASVFAVKDPRFHLYFYLVVSLDLAQDEMFY